MTLSPPPGADGVRLTLPPGQRAIMSSFAKHGLDSLYVPSDFMDLRVCSAMAEKGLLARWELDGLRGYELTPAGRAALSTSPKENDHE
ncbi:MAG: hypothetical protein KAX46_10950 [Chromatiaceae bacterium]|nr:hypothetical protein [Chromatiaceae bacterium]